MPDPDLKRPVGLTKEVGWQIGVRRTVPLSVEDAWTLLFSKDGLKAWLGDPVKITFAKGEPYQLKNGTTGEIRVFEPQSHIRLTWQPSSAEHPSTIQVRVLANNGRCTIAFHQEHLNNPAERAQRRRFIQQALDQLMELANQ